MTYTFPTVAIAFGVKNIFCYEKQLIPVAIFVYLTVVHRLYLASVLVRSIVLFFPPSCMKECLYIASYQLVLTGFWEIFPNCTKHFCQGL